MSSDKSRPSRYKNELIFGNSPSDTLNKPMRDAGEADERVDLEIILFGPKSRYLSDISELEPKRTHSAAPYLSEFDPFSPSSRDDKSERSGKTSGPAESPGNSKRSPSKDDQVTSKKAKSNKRVTHRTLERMERMYKDVAAGASSAGNDTYIDYMDYF